MSSVTSGIWRMGPVRNRARNTDPNVRARLSVADAMDLPFEDASFDMVISNGVLNLVPDKSAAFQEIHRVLVGGGTLAVADLLVVWVLRDHLVRVGAPPSRPRPSGSDPSGSG